MDFIHFIQLYNPNENLSKNLLPVILCSLLLALILFHIVRQSRLQFRFSKDNHTMSHDDTDGQAVLIDQQLLFIFDSQHCVDTLPPTINSAIFYPPVVGETPPNANPSSSYTICLSVPPHDALLLSLCTALIYRVLLLPSRCSQRSSGFGHLKEKTDNIPLCRSLNGI